MTKKPTSPQPPPSPAEPKRRISTQIHRRNKAKAVYPMTEEWEDSLPDPPPHLRIPSNHMKKA